MDGGLKEKFQKATYVPESRLSEDIWSAILSRNARIIKWKRFGYLSLSLISLSLNVLSIKTLIEQFTKMGFFKYLSLAFSDSGIIASYWKEYVYSLADSFPIASSIITIFLLFILFIFIKRTSRQFSGKLLLA